MMAELHSLVLFSVPSLNSEVSCLARLFMESVWESKTDYLPRGSYKYNLKITVNHQGKGAMMTVDETLMCSFHVVKPA
jgi:hypothetical protein